MAKRNNNDKPFYFKNGFWIFIGVVYLIIFGFYKIANSDSDDYDYDDNYNGTVEIILDDEDDNKYDVDEVADEVEVTPEMIEALGKAEMYNQYTPLSHDETITWLIQDDVSEEVAIYAADNCQTDWNENAYNRAVQLVEGSGISKARLERVLIYVGFSSDEIEYAMDSLDVDWNEEAVQHATERVDSEYAISYKELVDAMEYEGFTAEEIEYGMQDLNVDWNEMCLKAAEEILKSSNVSKAALNDRLSWRSYTEDEMAYAIDNVNVDWNREAKDRAKEYLIYKHTSYKGVYDVLISEKFEEEYAEYGASNCGADWEEEAELVTEEYIKKNGDVSDEGEYRSYMLNLGFEESEIAAALSAVND